MGIFVVNQDSQVTNTIQNDLQKPSFWEPYVSVFCPTWMRMDKDNLILMLPTQLSAIPMLLYEK